MYTINSKDIFRTPTSVLTIPGLTNPMANVTPNPSQSAQSIIVNVEESTKQDGVLDLVKPFDLQRIKIESVRIASGKTNQFIVHPTTNHFIYIIKGEGILYTRYGEGVAKDGQALRKDDCFSFPSQADKVEYSIEAKDQEVLVITFADPEGSERPVTTSPPSSPAVHAAYSLRHIWRRSGINRKKNTRLTAQTDISLSVPADKTPKERFLPWNVNLQEFPSGCHSSNPHCHSKEDEIALVLSGKARYWFQGETPEKTVKAGDCVGWRAGTGVCHSLLNDADGPDGEGETLVLLVWGENEPGNDKLYYATTHPTWWTDTNRWFDRPELPVGDAPFLPRYPRPDDK